MTQPESIDVQAMRLALADAARRLWWLPLVTGIIWTLASLVVLRFDAISAGVGILAGIVFLIAFVGAAALLKGVTDIVMAFQLRALGRDLSG